MAAGALHGALGHTGQALEACMGANARDPGSRVIVLMSNSPERKEKLRPGFGEPDPAMAAADIDRLEPGQSVELTIASPDGAGRRKVVVPLGKVEVAWP